MNMTSKKKEESFSRNRNVKAVQSNQMAPLDNLEKIVLKYANSNFLRPIAEHTKNSFILVQNFVEEFYKNKILKDKSVPKTVILDSGCGTGESTQHLAQKFSEKPIIGIDKSEIRLNKAQNAQERLPNFSNAFYTRGELLDFWRLAFEQVKSGIWHIPHHAIYYPNPWPKQSESKRRFHLHPIFPTLLKLSMITELRTNWKIYAEEFSMAASILGYKSELIEFIPQKPETAFERKYKESNQKLWKVIVKNLNLSP